MEFGVNRTSEARQSFTGGGLVMHAGVAERRLGAVVVVPDVRGGGKRSVRVGVVVVGNRPRRELDHDADVVVGVLMQLRDVVLAHRRLHARTHVT